MAEAFGLSGTVEHDIGNVRAERVSGEKWRLCQNDMFRDVQGPRYWLVDSDEILRERISLGRVWMDVTGTGLMVRGGGGGGSLRIEDLFTNKGEVCGVCYGRFKSLSRLSLRFKRRSPLI